MVFNGSRCCHRGYLTTRKSHHNYRCEGQWEGQLGGGFGRFCCFFYAAQLLPLNYHHLSDLRARWSSKQSQKFEPRDRLVFTKTLPHLFPSVTWRELHHLAPPPPHNSQGHFWLTNYPWLHNVMRPWTNISCFFFFFKTIDLAEPQSIMLNWPGMKCSVKSVAAGFFIHLRELLNIHLKHTVDTHSHMLLVRCCLNCVTHLLSDVFDLK